MAKAMASVSLDGGQTWREVAVTSVATENEPLALEEIATSTLLVLGGALPAEISKLVEQIQTLTAQSKELITPDEQGKVPALDLTPQKYEEWGNQLVAVRAFKKSVNEGRLEYTRPIDRIKSEMMERVRPWTDALDAIESNIFRLLEAWRQEQRRKDAAAAVQQQLTLKTAQDDRAVAAADKLEKSGRPEVAQRVLQQAAARPAPPVTVNRIPEVKGLSYKGAWLWEIIEADKLPREYLSPDEKRIGGRVEDFGEHHNIDGVFAWWDPDAAPTVRTKGAKK